MDENVLIEWTKEGSERQEAADVTVFQDGHVRLGSRFDRVEYRLSPNDLDALRKFIFDEQHFHEIEEKMLRQDVERAGVSRRRASEGSEAEFIPAQQMDAGTTIICANSDGTAHKVSYFDLVGDAQSYPEVEPLQRLRRIELRLIELTTAKSA